MKHHHLLTFTALAVLSGCGMSKEDRMALNDANAKADAALQRSAAAEQAARDASERADHIFQQSQRNK